MASSVTSAYALKTSSIPKLFEEIKKAATPQRFTQDFLIGIGFASSTDSTSHLRTKGTRVPR